MVVHSYTAPGEEHGIFEFDASTRWMSTASGWSTGSRRSSPVNHSTTSTATSARPGDRPDGGNLSDSRIPGRFSVRPSHRLERARMKDRAGRAINPAQIARRVGTAPRCSRALRQAWSPFGPRPYLGGMSRPIWVAAAGSRGNAGQQGGNPRRAFPLHGLARTGRHGSDDRRHTNPAQIGGPPVDHVGRRRHAPIPEQRSRRDPNSAAGAHTMAAHRPAYFTVLEVSRTRGSASGSARLVARRGGFRLGRGSRRGWGGRRRRLGRRGRRVPSLRSVCRGRGGRRRRSPW